MVAICHDMDLGDSWEHADNPAVSGRSLPAGYPDWRQLCRVRDDALRPRKTPHLSSRFTAPAVDH